MISTGHYYIKGSNRCIICTEIKDEPLVNANGEACYHDCKTREVQGDGRWVWCPRCKSYVDPKKESK